MKTVKQKYEFCMKVTADCLSKALVLDEKGEILIKWAKDYYSDAEYYFSQGDENTALEAIAYAHGFIDSGVLLGHLKINGYHLEKRI